MQKIVDAEGFTSVDGVILGVDTHLDEHVAVALDRLGRRLGELAVPTTTKGYKRDSFVGRRALAVWDAPENRGNQQLRGRACPPPEGCGGLAVVEVERPKRHHRPRTGKSDPKDAEAAARAVLAGEALGEPKSGDGRVEMIRTLRSARQAAVKARTQAANQLQALLVTAPEVL